MLTLKIFHKWQWQLGTQQKPPSTVIKILRKILNILNQNIVSGTIGKNTIIEKKSIVDKYTFIGNETFINTNCMITKSKIGNYCSIGSGVVIGPGEHNLDAISLSGRFYKNTYDELTNRPCDISHDVWIGTNAIIMRGVKVGTGAVIGAGAIVTKDVPDFAIVVGVPAKILKYRFKEEKQKIIMQSKWFEKDLEDAKETIKNFE